jgi:hypothetical protein
MVFRFLIGTLTSNIIHYSYYYEASSLSLTSKCRKSKAIYVTNIQNYVPCHFFPMWEGAWSRDLEELFWLFVLIRLLLFDKDFKSEAVYIHILIVVIYFWASHAEDGMYPSWTKCRNLIHDCWGIDKNREERSVFQTLFQLFSALFIFLFLLPKSSGFLDWLWVFIMLNSFILYLVFKVG